MFILGNEGRLLWRENTRIQRNPTLKGSVLRGTGDARQQLEEQSSPCSVSRGATVDSLSIQSHRQKRTTPILVCWSKTSTEHLLWRRGQTTPSVLMSWGLRTFWHLQSTSPLSCIGKNGRWRYISISKALLRSASWVWR